MIWRVKFIFIFILVFFSLIVIRLFYWQVLQGNQLSLTALSQYIKVSQVRPVRGEIRTADNFPLVSNQIGFLVIAKPKEIKDKNDIEKLARQLAPILEMEEASISAILHRDLAWVPLKNRVDKKTKEKIDNLNLAAIDFERQDFRFYPEASMAAHLVGFVGKDDSGEDKGYFGLEGSHNRELRGKTGKIKEIKDARGRPILVADKSNDQAFDGQNLVLYLDRRAQFIVEEKLKEAIEKYGAKGGTVAIMDPATGGIIASASYPNYETAKYQQYEEAQFRDPFISDSYEPGSTFKVLVMASALNEGVVSAETKCDSCSGPVIIGDYTIRTWNNKYFPDSSMVDVIEHSDNTGMVFVSRRLGLDKLVTYLTKFGIGTPTGIDLQGEANLPLRSSDQWYPIDLATAAFGQGVALTPIQMLTAVSAIANGGKLMEPHVVYKIVDNSGREVAIKPKVVREVLSQNTARIITEMMVNAVDKGEAKWAKPKGYRIAGKTGTSQIPIAGHYDPNKTVASFVGFAPADNPKFVMLVKINEPTSSVYGSETAAPLFFSIARELLLYYNIPPKE